MFEVEAYMHIIAPQPPHTHTVTDDACLLVLHAHQFAWTLPQTHNGIDVLSGAHTDLTAKAD